jgi:hypothetical protein
LAAFERGAAAEAVGCGVHGGEHGRFPPGSGMRWWGWSQSVEHVVEVELPLRGVRAGAAVLLSMPHLSVVIRLRFPRHDASDQGWLLVVVGLPVVTGP